MCDIKIVEIPSESYARLEKALLDCSWIFERKLGVIFFASGGLSRSLVEQCRQWTEVEVIWSGSIAPAWAFPLWIIPSGGCCLELRNQEGMERALKEIVRMTMVDIIVFETRIRDPLVSDIHRLGRKAHREKDDLIKQDGIKFAVRFDDDQDEPYRIEYFESSERFWPAVSDVLQRSGFEPAR